MAAVYFMGAKCITSKKNGNQYYPASFLTKNSWGNWCVVTKFCADFHVYDELHDFPVGSPVFCTLGMQGELLKAVAHDTVPALDLDDDDGI